MAKLIPLEGYHAGDHFHHGHYFDPEEVGALEVVSVGAVPRGGRPVRTRVYLKSGHIMETAVPAGKVQILINDELERRTRHESQRIADGHGRAE